MFFRRRLHRLPNYYLEITRIKMQFIQLGDAGLEPLFRKDISVGMGVGTFSSLSDALPLFASFCQHSHELSLGLHGTLFRAWFGPLLWCCKKEHLRPTFIFGLFCSGMDYTSFYHRTIYAKPLFSKLSLALPLFFFMALIGVTIRRSISMGQVPLWQPWHCCG